MSAVPQPFKQRRIITHLHKPGRTVLGKQLLYKHMVIWNYVIYLFWSNGCLFLLPGIYRPIHSTGSVSL